MPIKNPGPSDASKTGAASRESSPERGRSPFSSVSLDNSPQSPESGSASASASASASPPPPRENRPLASFLRGPLALGGLSRPSSQRESGAQGSGGASGPGGRGSSGQVGPGDGGLLPGAKYEPVIQYSETKKVELDAPPWIQTQNARLIYSFFLEGRPVLRQEGQGRNGDIMVTFNGIMSYSAEDLEAEHKFIQHIFPTTTISPHNRTAPILDEETVQVLNMDSDVQRRQRMAFRIMLNFLKLEEMGAGTPKYQIVPSCDYRKDKPKWLNQNDHNQLRLSRMVKSLYLLGNEKEAIAFHHAINLLGNKYGVPLSTMRYWDKCAVQAIVKKQEFLPGVPKEGLALLEMPSLMPRKAHKRARDSGETRPALTISLADAQGKLIQSPVLPSAPPAPRPLAFSAPRPSAPPASRLPAFRALQPNAHRPSRGIHRAPPPAPPRDRGLAPQQPPVSEASGTRVLTESEKKTMEELEARFKRILERGKK